MDLLFGFSGRIGRLQWWLAQGVGLALLIACMVVVYMLGTAHPHATAGENLSNMGMSGIVVLLGSIVLMVWINFASTVKRFHDRNKSGWWMLIVFVPYVGGVWQLVECGFLSGSRGLNDYGGPSGFGTRRELEEIFGPDEATDYGMIERFRARETKAPAGTQASVPSVRRGAQAQGFGRRRV